MRTETNKTGNVRLYLGIFVAAALVLVIALQKLSERGVTLWQTQDDLRFAANELFKSQSSLQTLLNDIEQLKFKKNRFALNKDAFWVVERDGVVEGNIQAIVEKAAKRSGLTITSLSNLSRKKVGEVAEIYEMTISAQTAMRPLVSFLELLQRGDPIFYWVSCSMNSKSMTGGDDIRFQGRIAFVAVVDEQLKELLQRDDRQG